MNKSLNQAADQKGGRQASCRLREEGRRSATPEDGRAAETTADRTGEAATFAGLHKHGNDQQDADQNVNDCQ